VKLDDLCSDLVMLPNEHRKNLESLLDALNPIEDFWIDLGNPPWKCNSGYRFLSEHLRVYKQLNEDRKKLKKKPLAIPMRSNHLTGNAVDIADPDQHLKFFIAEHLELFEDQDIYFEAFAYTPGWVHMQRVQPKSKNRFFIPF
jgi:hypothetical protein